MTTAHRGQQATSAEATHPMRRKKMRWSLIWHVFFYGELVASMGTTLWLTHPAWKDAVLLFALTLLLGSWYSLCLRVPLTYWRQHPLLTQGYLVISWGIWFALADRQGIYWIVLFGLYTQVYALSAGIWKLPGALILSALSLWRLIEAMGLNYGILLIFMSLILVGLPLALYLDSIHRQNREKDLLLRELEATRQELAATSRQAGVMQERQRLAYEIHDTLAQGFTSIIMHVEAAEGARPGDMNTAQLHLDHIRQTARENLVEARHLMWALQPEALERASLPRVLTHLSKKWSEENNIAVGATITGAAHALRPQIEVIVLRAAQEGLANVRKHAGASQVTITLSYMGDMVALDVQDDGIGFDSEQLPISPDEHTNGGFGLRNLRERVEHLGGIFSIESAHGEGSTLAVALPALPLCTRELQNASETAKELPQ